MKRVDDDRIDVCVACGHEMGCDTQQKLCADGNTIVVNDVRVMIGVVSK